ncbi:uncharacterized protein LOC126826791 [Patella vulgata]|uniref:uncharacterized protein LOC126826791 n=1 Tax=Patella vulgata TaxID=6465 RepID=UPI00217FAF89|nr:uncharacterized protein LOC126826791 [Patella vulgata]
MTMLIKAWLLCQLAVVSVEMLESLPSMETFFGLKLTCTFPPATCFNRCFGIDSRGSSCKCDKLCVVFGDCCPDFYTFCYIFPNNEIMLKFIKSNGRPELTEQEMNRIEAFADSSSCNKVMIGNFGNYIYIRSIATCNKDYPNGDIKDKCEGRTRAFPLDIPLSVLSTPFMTYQNVYCAVCNYLDLTEGIKYWSAKIKCQVDIAVTLRTIEELRLYPEERCQTLLTSPDDVQLRICDGHLDHQSCSKNKEVQIPPDTSEREARSVSDSGPYVKAGYVGSGGVKYPSSSGRHDIRKRNADDTQEVNITLFNSGSDNTGHNVTKVDAFQRSASSSNDNLTEIDKASTPSLLLKTTSLPTESVTIAEKTIITTQVVKSQVVPMRMPFNLEADSSNNTVSTVASTDSPRDPLQAELNIQDSENTNSDVLIENNLSLLCDAYYYQYNRDRMWYKNPHCYACQHGWGVFKDTNTTSKRNEIKCRFTRLFDQEMGLWPSGTKEVNHQFGVYGNTFVFYSSDLGTVLDEVPSNCDIGAVYDMISHTCKATECPQGFLPYFETCVNTTLYSLYISNINDSTTLYVTMDGSTTAIYDRYLDLVQNVVDDLESVDFNKVELDQSSGMVSVNRSIKLTSLDLVKQGYLTEHITAHGELFIEHIFTLLQLKITVPILFNDTSQTLHDLMYGDSKQFLLENYNMTIRNYEVGTVQSCPTGISQTHTNLPMISIGRHVFVDIMKQLVDISKARFTIGRNANNSWIVESITYCGRTIFTEGQTVKTTSTISLLCNDTVTLDRAMFDEIGERVRLKTGELMAPSDFVRNGEDLVVCREALSQQSLILDRNSQILYKNILTIISIILKLLTFLVSICRKYSIQGGAYFYILALTTSFIDVVHLLENLTIVIIPTILPIMLHFSWLFALYNSMAWCINMIGSDSKRTISCCSRHLVISAIVPIATVVICATGDINDPPWDIGYGSNSHIFSAKPNVVLYGYVLPASVAVVITVLCHIYRIVRRKMYEKDKIFYSCNMLVTGLLVVQFTFGCLEGREDSTVFYYLYFTSSIIVSWTFLAICVLIWMKKPTRLSSSLKYMEATTTKSENIYETAD